MNNKPGTLEATTAPAPLYDYVAREFAKVEPDGAAPLTCDSLDDWDPLADSEELDSLLLEQYRRHLAD